MEDKKNKIYISTVVIFWVMFAFFILVLLSMYGMDLIEPYFRFIFFTSMFILPCLGIVMIILTARAKFTRISKVFLIFTGASAIGIIVSGVLHNLVYALLVKLVGEGIFGGIGDEPVFFILATLVFPGALLVSSIGSIVLIAKKRIIA